MVSHTKQKNASQGLKVYLARLLASSLPPVRAKGEALAAMSRNERMRWYLGEFGQHFEADESTTIAPKGGNMSDLSKLTKAQLIEMLEADTDEATDEDETSSEEGFVVGCTFTYKAKATGKSRKHKIVRVSKTHVFTNTDKRFRTSTLEALNGGIVQIV
jgi:hypothetical protein